MQNQEGRGIIYGSYVCMDVLVWFILVCLQPLDIFLRKMSMVRLPYILIQGERCIRCLSMSLEGGFAWPFHGLMYIVVHPNIGCFFQCDDHFSSRNLDIRRGYKFARGSKARKPQTNHENQKKTNEHLTLPETLGADCVLRLYVFSPASRSFLV